MEPSQPAIALNDLGSEMAEVIKEFLVESNEGLDRFDRDLIALEKDRNSHELLDSIFRAIHTIKGTGGVLGYEKLVSISHLGETVLSRMRTASWCFQLRLPPRYSVWRTRCGTFWRTSRPVVAKARKITRRCCGN